MVQARYQYAIDVMLTRLRMIDADLTEKNERPLIRNLCSRIKTDESIVKKLERKEREVTFETAVNTLNDIAGVRVVCYFADDIYQIADAVRRQKDFTIVKEKNYIRKPKKSGYQSLLTARRPFCNTSGNLILPSSPWRLNGSVSQLSLRLSYPDKLPALPRSDEGNKEVRRRHCGCG